MPSGLGSPGSRLRIECGGVLAYHPELKAKDYRYLNPGIQEPPWTRYEIHLTDPFGNTLIFFQPE